MHIQIKKEKNNLHWKMLICSSILSSDIFTLDGEQQKVSGSEFDIPGCWYCTSLLRYVILSTLLSK
jgi:hypothetical protein